MLVETVEYGGKVIWVAIRGLSLGHGMGRQGEDPVGGVACSRRLSLRCIDSQLEEALQLSEEGAKQG